MFEQEINEMKTADLLLHLNAEKEKEFRSLLLNSRHALLYPPVPSVPTGPSGKDILIVASNNSANVQSLIWFLREVAPKTRGISIKIVGEVADGVQKRAAGEFELSISSGSSVGWMISIPSIRAPDYFATNNKWLRAIN